MYLLAPVVQYRGLFCGTAVPGTKKIAEQQIPGYLVPGYMGTWYLGTWVPGVMMVMINTYIVSE